jgi:dihydroorotate dehydrogenase electron transfer subunit
LNKVIYNKRISPGFFRIGIEWKVRGVRPGQFVMLRVTEGLDPFLRRPFGIYRVLGSGGKRVLGGSGIEIVYKVVGRGTGILAAKEPGERVDVIGPFGNGFPILRGSAASKVVMVAGGIGVAPFYLLAGHSVSGGLLLFGARSGGEAAITRDFTRLGCRVHVATEDGSLGTRGLVTGLLTQALKPGSVVYACGPLAMLKAVARIAENAGVKCLVSLERAMACGIGVCLGCAVKTRDHKGEANGHSVPGGSYKMVCSDGPVFDSSEIDWERL